MLSNPNEEAYLDLLRNILNYGEHRPAAREGQPGTISLFGPQIRIDLQAGFPLWTTRRLSFKTVVVELLLFLGGHTNVSWLHEHGVHIWDQWAKPDGELGPIYGAQWRSWKTLPEFAGIRSDGVIVYPYQTIDQIATVIENIKTNPFSRRHVVSAWNVADLPHMALEPCHAMFQFYVHKDHTLSCHVYQRSADFLVGVPHNIASYDVLTVLIARQCGLRGVRSLTFSFGDAHVYENNIDQAELQLSRPVKEPPILWTNPGVPDIDHYTLDDFRIIDYDPWPAIKVQVNA